MSDTGRKGIGEQLQEKTTPQDQKSYTQQASETVSGAYDRVSAAVVPDQNKSTTQQASDKIRGGSDDASAQGQGLVDQAKGATNSLLGGNQQGTGRRSDL